MQHDSYCNRNHRNEPYISLPETYKKNEKPLVECSFVTEFEDHIFVTVDAEAFFFLHDLITSYIREKDRVMGYSQGFRVPSPDPAHDIKASRSEEGRGGDVNSKSKGEPSGELNTSISEEEKKKNTFDSSVIFTKNWRSYHCKTWHLEPTVRLLSWGGKSIEPYGVDYILQKLGFSHARTTIPKWMQRVFMDPLDKVLAVLVLRIIQIVREELKSEADERRRLNNQ